jgi:hypothetical protein
MNEQKQNDVDVFSFHDLKAFFSSTGKQLVRRVVPSSDRAAKIQHLLDECKLVCGSGREALDRLEHTRNETWIQNMEALLDTFPPFETYDGPYVDLIDVIDDTQPGALYHFCIGSCSVVGYGASVDRVSGTSNPENCTVAWYVRKGHYLASLAIHTTR